MNEPFVSDKFDMEDIRRIRDYNSKRHITMTRGEIISDVRSGADELLRKIENRKNFSTVVRFVNDKVAITKNTAF